MYVFLDTETTGFARGGVQPRIVSIAWMISDNPTRPRTFKYSVIRPDGFVIPAQAAAVHGITTKRAIEEGKPIMAILSEFSNDLNTLRVKNVVAHNSKYDLPVIAAEFEKTDLSNPCASLDSTCTMIEARKKWPGESAKLADVFQKIFRKPMENAHNASGDVWACAQVFFYLTRGHMR